MKIIDKTYYRSPMMRIVEIKVHGLICTSNPSQTENTTEEELFS